MVSNQVIVGGIGGVLDLDFNALNFILDLYEIPNKRQVFEKVLGVSRYFIKEEREKQKT